MNIEVKVSKDRVLNSSAKMVAYFLEEKFAAKELDKALDTSSIHINSFLKESKFTGAKSLSAQLPVTLDGKKIVHLFFAGLGKKGKDKKFCFETFRRAIGSVVKCAQGKKVESLALQLPASSLFGMDSDKYLEQVYVIAAIAGYNFDQFISKDKDDTTKPLVVTLCVDSSDQKELKKAAASGEIIAQSVNRARHWIDLPPAHLNPTDLANHAKKLAKDHGLKCTIFGEKEIKAMGMGGLAGVSAGSSQDAKFVILEYKSKKKNAPTLGFVGKGITFDSGGLSLKPANFMETMKEDMSGASSVINALAAVAQLKPDVNVVGFAAIAENMPGSSATKPGDIITFYNGKTAEVLNTDAEGRLILADALSYAVKNYDLDCVIDVATLTGACIYAVGPFYTALMSDNDELAGKVESAACRSGDYVWRLPFTEDFKAAIKSPVADMQNVGNRSIAAGTITAAWFLRNFSGDTPWVHLDIASTAYNVPNIAYYGKGATGSSVRLLIDLAMNWKK